MKTFAQRLLLLSIVVFFLGGCATGTKLGGLTVKLIEIRPLPGAQAELTLEYYNDNLLPVGVSRSQNRITLNGEKLQRLAITKPVGVPRLATARQVTTVTLENPAIIELLRSSDAVTYTLESAMEIDAGSQDLVSKSNASGTAQVIR
jgi:hypothetical protein